MRREQPLSIGLFLRHRAKPSNIDQYDQYNEGPTDIGLGTGDYAQNLDGPFDSLFDCEGGGVQYQQGPGGWTSKCWETQK
jgi:hypothetical protein